MRMSTKFCCSSRLAPQMHASFKRIEPLIQQDFESNASLKFRILRQVYLTHATGAQFLDDAKSPAHVARLERRGGPVKALLNSDGRFRSTSRDGFTGPGDHRSDFAQA